MRELRSDIGGAPVLGIKESPIIRQEPPRRLPSPPRITPGRGHEPKTQEDMGCRQIGVEERAQGLLDFFSATIDPNKPSASPLGPAVKNSVFLSTLAGPVTMPQSPSMTRGSPLE